MAEAVRVGAWADERRYAKFMRRGKSGSANKAGAADLAAALGMYPRGVKVNKK